MIQLIHTTALQSDPTVNAILWLFATFIITPIVGVFVWVVLLILSSAVKFSIIRGLDAIIDLEHLKEETVFEESIQKSLFSGLIASGYWITVESPYVPSISVDSDVANILTNTGEMIFILSIMGSVGLAGYSIYLLATKRHPNQKTPTNVSQ